MIDKLFDSSFWINIWDEKKNSSPQLFILKIFMQKFSCKDLISTMSFQYS